MENLIKVEIARITRSYMAVKLFLPLIASVIVPILFYYFGSNEAIKPYFYISGPILFFLIIIIDYFSPWIVMKKYQIDDYLFDLNIEKRTYKNQIKLFEASKAKEVEIGMINLDQSIIEERLKRISLIEKKEDYVKEYLITE